MHQAKLTHCLYDCCYFIDERPAGEAEYEEAKRKHPGSFPGVALYLTHTAPREGVVACRRQILPENEAS